MAVPFVTYKIRSLYQKFVGKSVRVETHLGPIVGLQVQSMFDYKYIGFQGVPYAKPPIGDLRFRVSKKTKFSDSTSAVVY